MKKIIVVLLLIAVQKIALTQNVGIGTAEPMNKLQVQGSLLVTTPTTATSTAPTAAQTKTMVNATTITFLNTDSTGVIYDPGGPSGNYLANMTANASIPLGINIGIEITVETMGLGIGDSLIIKEFSFSTDNLLAVGNGYSTTRKWVFNSPFLHIIFKSNADANTGIGFSLLFKRLYDNNASLPDVLGATGNALFFDTKNGSFRSGLTNSAARGNYSTAMGHSTYARSYASTAMGDNTVANGSSSTAMGDNSSASGDFSTAIGNNTNASGNASTAMGYLTNASGDYSIAMGYITIASGDNSTAMGKYVSTNNFEGSFVIGDNSTTTFMNSANANNFRARFAGGYKLFTSANLTTGCTLFAGDNAWTTGSDVRTKENFSEISGEDFLKKISDFKLTTWNYKTQNPKTFRHYGPMAQDFYAAFGKDEYGTIGNDTTINSADFAGVSFVAIQALEKRTAEYKKEVDELKTENTTFRTLLLQLRKEVDGLHGIKKEKL
jgi:Chaperone of endosialidase/Head domain of trimeric autotransporter adhesin